jgi:hypothetical protein
LTSTKSIAVFLLVILAAISCAAQQKFPLRPGEWSSATPDPMHPGGPPMTLLFCMNDATWAKALNGSHNCAMQELHITSGGGSYSLACSSTSFQMKGNFKIAFDGMTHMVTSGSMDMTYNGKTNHTDSKSDFRWKGPTCNPSVDMNLKNTSRPPQ